MSEYRLTILDRDGEEHCYDFIASHLWEVTDHVWRKMAKGDFYGHSHMQTMNLDICELVIGTLGADAIDLQVTAQE